MEKKRILLVDFDDTRRSTRVALLESAGFDVKVRDDYVSSDFLDNEGTFDLMLLALHRRELNEAAAYSERVLKHYPSLPILLITDIGVFAPKATLSRTVEGGNPHQLLVDISEMLASSSHIKTLDNAQRSD